MKQLLVLGCYVEPVRLLVEREFFAAVFEYLLKTGLKFDFVKLDQLNYSVYENFLAFFQLLIHLFAVVVNGYLQKLNLD